MTKREATNRRRCEDALNRHWHDARRRNHGHAGAGPLLYSFLDAALGSLKPSQADAARSNAVRFLRRRAKRARGQRGE